MSAVADNPSRLVSVCHMNAAWDAQDIASQNLLGVTTQVVTGQVVQGVTSQVVSGQVVQGVTSQVGTGQVVQGVTTQVRVDDVVQSFPVLDKTEVRRESVDTRGEEVSVEHFESFSKNGNDDKTPSDNSNDESISDSQPEMTTKKIFKSNIPNSIDSMSIDSINVEGGGERKTKLPELESPPELTQDTETLQALLKSIIVDKTIGTLLDKVVSERLNGRIVSSDETNLHSNSENNNLNSQSNVHSNSQSNLHSSHKDRDIVQDILAQLSTVDLSSFQAPFGENSPKLGSPDRHKESLKSHEVNTKTSDTLNTEAGNMYSSEKARKRSLTDLPSYEEDEELSVLPPSGERQSVRDEL